MYAADGTVGQSGLWIHDAFVGANDNAAAYVGIKPSLGAGHAEIALFKDGGTFKVPVLINGAIVLDFIVDSGAADVNIPADVAMTSYSYRNTSGWRLPRLTKLYPCRWFNHAVPNLPHSKPKGWRPRD